MGQHILFQVLESGIYIFGAHFEKCPVNWNYKRDRHDLFELIYVISGEQKTILNDDVKIICRAGDSIIISPGTVHQNFNNSKSNDMSYFCFHFNIESLKTKSSIIKNIGNVRIPKEANLSKAARKVASKMMDFKNQNILNSDVREIKNEIAFLEFMQTLVTDESILREQKNLSYSDREAQLAKSIAVHIENELDNEEDSAKIGDVYNRLNISNAYGHRVFKKVYGTSPFKYMEEQRYGKAKLLLGVPEYTIEDVAYMMKFNSLASFSKQFKKWAGMSPRSFRKKMVLERHDANYLHNNQQPI